ncbi:chemotaxis protein CheB [Deltaproteobacteria bacterium TL4]
MRVFQIEDSLRVQPNCVYVIPPNNYIGILPGVLQLIHPKEDESIRMSADYFLRSLAQDQGERAIVIILSGMGTDGTLGLKAIKGELGMAMVQDPGTAKSDGMPKSAIGTNVVDYILPVEKMPETLVNYTRHALKKVTSKITLVDEKFSDALQKIFILIRTHTGHTFHSTKTQPFVGVLNDAWISIISIIFPIMCVIFNRTLLRWERSSRNC